MSVTVQVKAEKGPPKQIMLELLACDFKHAKYVPRPDRPCAIEIALMRQLGLEKKHISEAITSSFVNGRQYKHISYTQAIYKLDKAVAKDLSFKKKPVRLIVLNIV